MFCRIWQGLGLAVLAFAALNFGPANAAVVTVNAQDDIYGAGQPGSPGGGNVPQIFDLPVGFSRSLTFSSVTGSVSYNIGTGSNFNDPDGIGSASDLSVNGVLGFSGIQADHAGFLAGVFLTDSGPGVAPADLDFRSGGLTTGFTTLTPELRQVFFIGDGLEGDGTGGTQTFMIPDAATRVAFGFADACNYHGDPSCYGDNQGSFVADYTIAIGSPVPLPPALPLMAGALAALGLIRRKHSET